jgi:ankyrin repeat protein
MSRRLTALTVALAGLLALVGAVTARGRQERLNLEVVHAVDQRDVRLVQQALARGGSPNARVDFPWPIGHYSYSALSEAVRQNDVAVACTLLEHGANPNAPGRWRLPALRIAREFGYRQMIELLRKYGARQ